MTVGVLCIAFKFSLSLERNIQYEEFLNQLIRIFLKI